MNFGDTIELCIHPSNKFNGEMNNVTSINGTNFYKDKNRVTEKDLLLSDQLKNFLTYKKINLINFSNIS